MQLTSGSRLGTYEIISPLGAGGMGEVYRARDLRLGREVAVKVLPAAVSSSPTRLARFEREARTVAGLNHSNIVTLYSIEDEDDICFLTMELVDGRTLASVITPDGLPLARLLDLAIPLVDALIAAHEKGIVHRDLKPANVMVTREGRIKVLDFGLAKAVHANADSISTQTATVAPLSMAGQVTGTVPYMAPEQLRGEAVDARSDIFSLGIMLYEMATGSRPFVGHTEADISSAILRDTPLPISRARTDISSDFERIVSRCLAKNPRERFQTSLDVFNELQGLRSGLERTEVNKPLGPTSEHVASIAVLPFVNRSRDEEDEYFADGITDEVIARLCKARTLKVISRSSVMSFKAHEGSVQEIAARLQVATVLEGSVRRVRDRVRIVAQLIDVGSGQSLWAESYDRQLTDIFDIQTDVALQIASALQAELTPAERKLVRREPTQDLVAYEHYLRGRYSLVQFTTEGELKSIEHFERAIERDAKFAAAYVGLTLAYTELCESGALSHSQMRAQATSAAEKAVSLDPELGEAHCALAYARMVYEFDWVGAETGFKRALELSPGSADTYDLYGRMCAGLERYDEAIALHQRAFELDPLTHRADLATSLLRAGRNEEALQFSIDTLKHDPTYERLHATLGWALFRLGRFDEGIGELQQAVELAPTGTMWLAQLGQAYALAGRVEDAREILRQLEDPSRPAPAAPYHLAYVYAGLGDAERAMDCLERAFEQGTGPLSGIKGSFLLAPLRHHPRFTALLKRIRLA